MKLIRYIYISFITALVISCSGIEDDFSIKEGPSKTVSYPKREVCEIPQRHVLLLYSSGFNSLSSYLKDDIQDLMTGQLPKQKTSDNTLLVYSHLTVNDGNYYTRNSPVLYRIYRNEFDRVVCDTLMRYPKETISASAQQFHNVLTYVKDRFPAESYGLIFSSHATGYLPAGYYTNPDGYLYQGTGKMRRSGNFGMPTPVPYIEPEHDPSLPAVKSIGEDKTGTYGNYVSYEMEIAEFAEAIPMKLSYLLFDACLMGGIEVAYELSGKTDLVGFSQTEVLAEGFDYKTLTAHLLKDDGPDPESVCRDYFTQYDIQKGQYRSATISLIDCNRLQSVSETCRSLFDTYRKKIMGLNPNKVQKYYRYNYHWFYDMKDIIAKAGATTEELDLLDDALEDCIVYKATTPSFMGAFYIDSYCGLSMFLPPHGNAELEKYYTTLRWNKDTELVQL